MAERTVFSDLTSGLRLWPDDLAAAAKAVAASVFGSAAFILILDAIVFRRWLPAEYVAIYTSPLLPRTILACLGAGVEEVTFRLIGMTTIVVVLGFWRRPVPAAGFIAAILLSQLVNVLPIVLAYPFWGALRFWAVGSLWGYLYWRHGWAAALAAHGTIHLLLDPLLLWALTQAG